MKKLLLAAIAFTGLFTLASCGGNNTPSEDASKPTVAPTLPNGGDKDETTDSKKPTATESTKAPEQEALTFTAKLLLPNGENLKDFKIQWCNDQSCFPPTKAKDGVASKGFKDDKNYYPHIMGDEIINNYAYDLNGYVQNKDNKDIEIQLYDLNLNVEGAGTAADPFKVTDGGIRVNIDKNGAVLYYTFTPKTTGTYVIESVAQFYGAQKILDPSLGLNGGNDFFTDGGKGKNFKHELSCTAGEAVTFMITSSTQDNIYPAVFDVLVTPKKNA